MGMALSEWPGKERPEDALGGLGHDQLVMALGWHAWLEWPAWLGDGTIGLNGRHGLGVAGMALGCPEWLDWLGWHGCGIFGMELSEWPG